MIASLEWKPAKPISGSPKTPGMPTPVIASVPAIVNGGAAWFRSMGREKSPGPKIYSLSGRVVRPGQYEAPMGTTMRELLAMAGGVRPGHELKFWTPGGSSTRPRSSRS